MLLRNSKLATFSSFIQRHSLTPLSHVNRYFTSQSQEKVASYLNPQFSIQEKAPFDKILIANRGEIACRIIRTCRKMGINTVAVHSEADANGLFVQMADESICIGPAASAQSYLQIERIVNAVKMTGAQAVHPGFGFLSERNEFAAELERNNVVFIGPRSYAIEVMGDKIMSKETATKAKVNVIPGDNRVIKDAAECVEVANQLGYPVMVKASAGGGGKGMRIAFNDKECEDAFRLATNEARSSFGDDRLFVEKFIEEPRHVEIQVLADTFGNVVYLNERECSIQRRNQKVYEEAPSPCVNEDLRQRMGKQACDLAKAVDYVTAGTVEFLVDKNGGFYFLEMNTRLQVEHPITEFITGVDIVEQMIQVAGGRKLPFTQKDIGINGWAIEARVYAENPYKGFLPSTGRLVNYKEPFKGDSSVRIDSGIEENAEISVHYDPMISKTIVHAKTRKEALEKMRLTLDSYVIHGLQHNIPFLRNVLEHKNFQEGNFTTKFIEQEYANGFSKASCAFTQDDCSFILGTVGCVFYNLRREHFVANAVNEMVVKFKDYKEMFGEQEHDGLFRVEIFEDGKGDDEYEVFVGGLEKPLTLNCDFKMGKYVFNCDANGGWMKQTCQVIPTFKSGVHTVRLQYKGFEMDFEVRSPIEEHLNQFVPKENVLDLERVLLAPMPGNIFSIGLKVGDKVVSGQEACVIEAMKMQNIFYVEKDGVVKNVYVKQGDSVQADQIIYELE